MLYYHMNVITEQSRVFWCYCSKFMYEDLASPTCFQGIMGFVIVCFCVWRLLSLRTNNVAAGPWSGPLLMKGLQCLRVVGSWFSFVRNRECMCFLPVLLACEHTHGPCRAKDQSERCAVVSMRSCKYLWKSCFLNVNYVPWPGVVSRPYFDDTEGERAVWEHVISLSGKVWLLIMTSDENGWLW